MNHETVKAWIIIVGMILLFMIAISLIPIFADPVCTGEIMIR